ncbi:MAG: hypothetical protein PVJ07_07030 [Anaerolineales bacterium]
MRRATSLLVLMAGLLAGGCGIRQPVEQAAPSPLYLTIIVHTEEDTNNCHEPKPQIPDYDDNQALLLHFTSVMRAFGEMAAAHGAKINFGSDWTFSLGVARYDPTFYADLQALGHEVDAHAHASCILYHEVRQHIIDAGITPTHVASGMNENEIYDQMLYFDQYYPEFSILWGVAIPNHGAGEEMSGWVWRPSRSNWLLHDPNGSYVHIGHGEQVNSVEHILRAIDNRYPARINTYAVFIAPREFLAAPGTPGIPDQWTARGNTVDYWENRLAWWDDFLSQLDGLEDLTYATLSEIVQIFEARESQLDFDFVIEDHPRSDAPLLARSRAAGYP